jgi:hypothetical protein
MGMGLPYKVTHYSLDTNGVSSIMTIANLIDHLETGVNWNKVFGVVCSTYGDKGFTSRADNFTKSTTIEKALDKFSNLTRVDQIGYDFTFEDLKVELKMRQNLFYKRTPHQTQTIKMKNFQGNKKTLEDFKNDQTFDIAIILCLTTFQAIVVEDDVARNRYYADGDGVFAKFGLGDYYKCDIGEVTPILPPTSLSESIRAAIDNHLDF